MAKRGSGEGTIVKRSDGRYCAALTVGRRPNGKLDRRWIYAATHDEARRLLNRAIKDRDNGVRLPAHRLKVGAFLREWLVRFESGWRAKTALSYRQIVEQHLVPTFEKTRLDRLHQSEMETLLKSKLASGLSATTVRYIRNVLRSALSQAMRDDLLVRNVAKLARVPKIRKYRPAPLSGTQAETLLSIVRDDRNGAVLAVALLGLRVGEIAGLQWSDVDIDGRSLSIHRQLQRIPNAKRPDGSKERRPRKIVVSEPKSEDSRRAVVLSNFAASALERHLARDKKERFAAGRPAVVPTDFVFTTQSGTALDDANLRRWFKAALVRAELPPKTRIHDLRHTCASLLAHAGVSAEHARATLGHSDVRLTMQVYTHVLHEGRRAVANALDKAVGR